MRVSEACLGTMTFRDALSWRAERPATLDSVFRDAGVSVIDTDGPCCCREQFPTQGRLLPDARRSLDGLSGQDPGDRPDAGADVIAESVKGARDGETPAEILNTFDFVDRLNL